jgi:CheY-like chemotaxis protein
MGDVRAALDWALRVTDLEITGRAPRINKQKDITPVRAGGAPLGQVFVNLLINPAQPIGEGRASEAIVEVSTSTDSGCVVVEVRDTGGGMTAEVQKRIFEPFFTTKPVGKGTGLGLSICHGIVTSAGGTIDVESNPGVGSRFRVRLPIGTLETKSAPPVSSDETPRLRGRLLVIDDEPQVGTAMRRVLTKHEVVSVLSANEALARLADDSAFDLIFCDVAMPERSGQDLYDELVATRPELAERIVFVTGGTFTPQLSAFLQSVPRPCLSKPFGAAELREHVAQLLEARAPAAKSS